MSAVSMTNSKVSDTQPGNDLFPPLLHPKGRQVIGYIQDPTLCETEFTPGVKSTSQPDAAVELTREAGTPFTLQTGLTESKLLGKEAELYYFRKLHFHYVSAARSLAESSTCRGQIRHRRDANRHLDQAFQVRSHLVESNLRLVVSIAKKYAPQSSGALEELISCGNAGLINAVDQFDYRRGFRFSTYAYTAIQRAVFAQLRSEGTHGQRFVDDSYEAAGKLAKDASEGTKQILAAEEAAASIQSVLHTLDDRELHIVRARFGFGQEASPQSFREIGEAIGLSKQRVGSIYHAAICKLRRALAA